MQESNTATADPVKPPKPKAGPATARWLGAIAGDLLYRPIPFDGPDNEAGAKEAYLKYVGIRSTTGKVVVTRAG